MRDKTAHRVAITGLGIISCLGRSHTELATKLRNGESGVGPVPGWADMGITSLVGGVLRNTKEMRQQAPVSKDMAFAMSEAALFCMLSAIDAVDDAGLTMTDLNSPRVACIIGNGSFGMATSVYGYSKLAMSGRSRRIPPYAILQCMSNSASACVANHFKVLGPSYSISSACATSAHNIGHAVSLIRAGVVDVAIAGGGEEVDGFVAAAFEGMRTALSSGYNDTPERASRPFDASRDGLVLSAGGGIVILESLEHAKARGARVRCEITGYGATSDGHALVAPRPDGAQAASCMQLALADADLTPDDIDYINAHATSTIAGDRAEGRAILDVFGDQGPLVSSTKSMTGHPLAAAGVHELIFCIAMLENNFVAPSINIDAVDIEFENLSIVREPKECDLQAIMTNNFGFGGTNASLVIQRTS